MYIWGCLEEENLRWKEKKNEVELEYCILYEFICYVVLWFVSLI